MAESEEQAELLTNEPEVPHEEVEEATREDAEEAGEDDQQPAGADDAGEGVAAENYTEEAQQQESELATDQDGQYMEQEEPQPEHEYDEPPAQEGEEGEEEMRDGEEAETEEVIQDEVPAEQPPADEDIDEPIEKDADEKDKEPVTDMRALEDDLTQFRHCIENIGTQLDDELNRMDMRKLRASIREKATRMENDLKDRQRVKDQMSPQQRIHLQQVIKQLDTQLTTYHELLERERAMTRKYPLVGVNLEQEGRTVDHAATPGQAQAMLKSNAQEREHEYVELMELERDIIGLQDIQTDLATLIADQADDVKLIEQNVERAGDRVEHGHTQMLKRLFIEQSERVDNYISSPVLLAGAPSPVPTGPTNANQSKTNRKIWCTVLTCSLSFATAVIILLVIVMAIILTR